MGIASRRARRTCTTRWGFCLVLLFIGRAGACPAAAPAPRCAARLARRPVSAGAREIRRRLGGWSPGGTTNGNPG